MKADSQDNRHSWISHHLFSSDKYLAAAAAAAKSLQSCPTLCDPIDGSPPGSPVPGVLQARTLEWVGCTLETSKPGFSPSMAFFLPFSFKNVSFINFFVFKFLAGQ